MSTLFIIQLITSFVVGGAFIALLSFITEKASKKVAGIILAFPTTVALGFFFLGWSTSPEAVVAVVPTTLIPLGLSIVFAAVYVHVAIALSTRISNKLAQIALTFVLSIAVWFIPAVAVVSVEVQRYAVGVMGYFALIALAMLLMKGRVGAKPKPLTYTRSQKLGRAVFVGFILFLVVLSGHLLSPFWGGMFTMFPAAFTSLLMILHWYYEPRDLFPVVHKVPLGSFTILAYATTVMLTFAELGFVLGTITAYAVSALVTVVLIKLQNVRFVADRPDFRVYSIAFVFGVILPWFLILLTTYITLPLFRRVVDWVILIPRIVGIGVASMFQSLYDVFRGEACPGVFDGGPCVPVAEIFFVVTYSLTSGLVVLFFYWLWRRIRSRAQS